MAAPQINVYASLPQNVILDTGNSLRRTDWSWVHCLSLPIEGLNELRLSRTNGSVMLLGLFLGPKVPFLLAAIHKIL